MGKVLEMLRGKKTYVIAATAIIIVVAEKVIGVDIPGVEVGDNALAFVLGALGLGALRSGVNTTTTTK